MRTVHWRGRQKGAKRPTKLGTGRENEKKDNQSDRE